ncbi:hypothetical protein K7472_21905 [Streptomyces sp. PTM05]|uniref:Secreted protein n=1 Tax=Streptantibioticus parmotrematis TaxID=2873249 RepID=A0ABS7QW76_9ACTN|nr:hypothetical protein [Streptantibioticus parmotrematis]MBY8887473.1 hypothetical protein [Streptantibioticus parmotrematis]
MSIDWGALGSVFGVSIAVTVGLVGLFTLGIVGLGDRATATASTASTTSTTEGRGAEGRRADGRSGGGRGPLVRAGAYACFAACAVAVAYGIWLIAG